MKHNPRCPFCGAPTRSQPFRDRTAYQCTECASLCVGPEVASELLLVMTGTPAGAPPRSGPRRARNAPLITVGLAVALFLLCVPVAIAVFEAVRGPAAVAPPQVEIPVVVTLPPPPVMPVAPPPAPPAPIEAPPEVAQVEAPGPAPAPRSARASIDLGWRRMDADPGGAAAAFREALEREPGNPEAQYGLGYALLQQGDKVQGGRHLCASRQGAGAELRREVESLLQHNDLKCP